MLDGYQVWILYNMRHANISRSALTGGESLYGKIYEGISRAKVFVWYVLTIEFNAIWNEIYLIYYYFRSCLSPRYASSQMCIRELTLADVLHKPILPLIVEFIPWPPPGPSALIISSIVYIDLCGKNRCVTENKMSLY